MSKLWGYEWDYFGIRLRQFTITSNSTLPMQCWVIHYSILANYIYNKIACSNCGLFDSCREPLHKWKLQNRVTFGWNLLIQVLEHVMPCSHAWTIKLVLSSPWRGCNGSKTVENTPNTMESTYILGMRG